MIYFTRSGDAVKIGHTNNPDLRMQTFRTANPNDIVVLGVMEGGEREEKQLHEMFARHRGRGEWFVLCDEIVKFIEANCRPYLAGMKRIGIMPPDKKDILDDLAIRVLILATAALMLAFVWCETTRTFWVTPWTPVWLALSDLEAFLILAWAVAMFCLLFQAVLLRIQITMAEYRYRKLVKAYAR